MLKVGFHNPDFPDGVVFDLGGIAVENNGSTELDEEAELRHYSVYHKGIRERLGDNPHVTIEGRSELSKAQRESYPGNADEPPTETEIETVDEAGEPAEPITVASDESVDEAPEGSES